MQPARQQSDRRSRTDESRPGSSQLGRVVVRTWQLWDGCSAQIMRLKQPSYKQAPHAVEYNCVLQETTVLTFVLRCAAPFGLQIYQR